MSAPPDPRVSVVIPTYQRRRAVLEAVDSALAQSYRSLEVIVADDASTDGTADLLEAGRPAVRVLRLARNGGASAARNAAIRAARGELIALLDSDDLFLPGKIARQVQDLDAHPRAVASFTLAGSLPGQGRVTSEEDPPRGAAARVLQVLEGRCAGMTSSALVRRAALERTGLYDESISHVEDVDLWARLAALGPLRLLRERLCVRRAGADSITRMRVSGDAHWRRMLARLLERPEGRLVRRHLRRILASREVRLAERLAFREEWRGAAAHLGRALALDPVAPVRVPHLRALLPTLVRFGLGSALGHDLGKSWLARLGLGRPLRQEGSATMRTGSS